jgi:hypothetical protein
LAKADTAFQGAFDWVNRLNLARPLAMRARIFGNDAAAGEGEGHPWATGPIWRYGTLFGFPVRSISISLALSRRRCPTYSSGVLLVLRGAYSQPSLIDIRYAPTATKFRIAPK